MSIQFEFTLVSEETADSLCREGRFPNTEEIVDTCTVADNLDVETWLRKLENSVQTVTETPCPGIEKDGLKIKPGDIDAPVIVPRGWIDSMARLDSSQVNRILPLWAEQLGETLEPGEYPDYMNDDLQVIIRFCRRAKENSLVLLYYVNF